jgi:hypothetical protein
MRVALLTLDREEKGIAHRAIRWYGVRWDRPQPGGPEVDDESREAWITADRLMQGNAAPETIEVFVQHLLSLWETLQVEADKAKWGPYTDVTHEVLVGALVESRRIAVEDVTGAIQFFMEALAAKRVPISLSLAQTRVYEGLDAEEALVDLTDEPG